MMRVPEINLSTDDGLITPLVLDDAAELAAITDHSVTSKVDFLPDVFGVEQAAALIAGQGPSDVFHAVRTHGDGALIGVIGVHAQDSMELEIGYWFAAEARGQGIAGRSVKHVVQHVSGQCAGCCIVAECAPANVKSWALLRGIGFAPMGMDGKRAGRRLLRWYADAGARIDVC
jgi:RimJ/RimL family protein N-acetyltransferase